MIIGYTYVVGDIFHKGHLLYLKNSKALCDRLIVGVLTERAVMERKPKPVLSLDERLEIISSIEYVDLAMPQGKYSPDDNCKLICPDILFESSSHKELGYNGGRRVVVFPYYQGQSSTKIKKEIKHGKSG